MNERTESELSEAYESERAALADAQDEIKAMQQHRITLLKTGTAEDVLALDDEIRLEGIKMEIATARMGPLKNELDTVQRERANWRQATRTVASLASGAALERLHGCKGDGPMTTLILDLRFDPGGRVSRERRFEVGDPVLDGADVRDLGQKV